MVAWLLPVAINFVLFNWVYIDGEIFSAAQFHWEVIPICKYLEEETEADCLTCCISFLMDFYSCLDFFFLWLCYYFTSLIFVRKKRDD